MYEEKIIVKEVNEDTINIIKEWKNGINGGRFPISIERKNIPDLIKKLGEVQKK